MPQHEIQFFASDNELARHVASAWLRAVASAPRTNTPQKIALSGGRIARKLFVSIAEQATAQKISLAHLHFFWADERCVPPSDPESNFAIASELLLRPLGIVDDHIHRIRGELDPDTAAAEAARDLLATAPRNADGTPVLDWIFLGMGEDGHVASLFPGEKISAIESPSVYRAVVASKPPPHRITLGYPTLAAAREVWTLVSGAGKERALADSLAPGNATPFTRVLTSHPHTKIFSDIKPAA
jgi:6-phosphogluconolactonase